MQRTIHKLTCSNLMPIQIIKHNVEEHKKIDYS